MNNSDYHQIQAKLNRGIKVLSFAVVALLAMIAFNIVVSVFRLPISFDPIRVILPDILLNYGLMALSGGEIGLGIVFMAVFLIIIGVLVLFLINVFKAKAWAFLWSAFYCLLEIPFLIIVRNFYAVGVHLLLGILLIYGMRLCLVSRQIDKRMWSF